jgi:hypothetical protein
LLVTLGFVVLLVGKRMNAAIPVLLNHYPRARRQRNGKQGQRTICANISGICSLSTFCALSLTAALSSRRKLLSDALRRSNSALAAVAVDALVSHPDIDACEAFLTSDSGLNYSNATGNRCSAYMPTDICQILSTEAFPSIVDEGFVYIEPDLRLKAPHLSGTLLGVPVKTGNQVLGGVVVWNHRAGTLPPWHQNLLEMAADIIVLARGRGSATTGASAPDLAAEAHRTSITGSNAREDGVKTVMFSDD